MWVRMLWRNTQRVFKVVTEALKPGIDAATPFVQQAGQEALKAASPVVYDGITTESVTNAAKVMDAKGEKSLALFPAKFQKSMLMKKGSFVVVDESGREEALEAGSKVA